MRKVMIALALASTSAGVTLAASPAAAQSYGQQNRGQQQIRAWRIQPAVQRQIQTDINQLETRIQRAAQRRTISPREATGLRRQARSLQQLYNRFRRNGLDRNEVRQLETQVNALHQRLRLERRDWDGRRG